jgi:hypothetical protein
LFLAFLVWPYTGGTEITFLFHFPWFTQSIMPENYLGARSQVRLSR